MKKENYCSYVIDAFRYYAACDRPTGGQLRALKDVLRPEQRGALLDLEAVDRVISKLKWEMDGEQLLRCLELVYFACPHTQLTRGVISERVVFACGELGLSESSIYRALRRLRLMMAIERGLRISEKEFAYGLQHR